MFCGMFKMEEINTQRARTKKHVTRLYHMNKRSRLISPVKAVVLDVIHLIEFLI